MISSFSISFVTWGRASSLSPCVPRVHKTYALSLHMYTYARQGLTTRRAKGSFSAAAAGCCRLLPYYRGRDHWTWYTRARTGTWTLPTEAAACRRYVPQANPTPAVGPAAGPRCSPPPPTPPRLRAKTWRAYDDDDDDVIILYYAHYVLFYIYARVSSSVAATQSDPPTEIYTHETGW